MSKVNLCGVQGCDKEAEHQVGGFTVLFYESEIKTAIYACGEHQAKILYMLEQDGCRASYYVNTVRNERGER